MLRSRHSGGFTERCLYLAEMVQRGDVSRPAFSQHPEEYIHQRVRDSQSRKVVKDIEQENLNGYGAHSMSFGRMLSN